MTLSCVREMLPFELPAGTAALLLMAVDGHPQDVEDRAAADRPVSAGSKGRGRCCRAKTVEEAERPLEGPEGGFAGAA